MKRTPITRAGTECSDLVLLTIGEGGASRLGGLPDANLNIAKQKAARGCGSLIEKKLIFEFDLQLIPNLRA